MSSVGDSYQGPWSTATFDGPCGMNFSWTKHGPGAPVRPFLQGASDRCYTGHSLPLGIIALYGSDGKPYVKGSCNDQSIRVTHVMFEHLGLCPPPPPGPLWPRPVRRPRAMLRPTACVPRPVSPRRSPRGGPVSEAGGHTPPGQA